MHAPRIPVEHLGEFRPPHCPWRGCAEHRRSRPGYRYRRHGYYSTHTRRRVPRFRCLRCGRTFSRQTFSVTYYLKRPALLRHVAAGVVAGSALRQIARSLACAPDTAARMAARLGRHAMLLHARCLDELRGRLTEPLAFDHFETFELTQDFPFGIATAVGADSWFVYALDPAPHARGGRRSPAQARRLRARPRRPSRGRYRGSARRVLDLLLELQKTTHPLTIRTDGHTDYDSAWRHHPQRHRLRHQRHPNPPRTPRGAPRSPRARLRDRALFPVDLLHKILRHTLAHHRRETIAFARRLNAAMERMALTAVWRNLVKKRSERSRDTTTPAMRLALTDARWCWTRVLARRLFYDRIPLPDPWPTLYLRRWDTPLLPANARHHCSRAF